jgi:hypothetical protein
MIGTAVGEDLRKSIPLIRDRVASIQRLDSMPNLTPGTGKVVANTYIDMVIRAIEELRP